VLTCKDTSIQEQTTALGLDVTGKITNMYIMYTGISSPVPIGQLKCNQS